MSPPTRVRIMDAPSMDRALTRIAHEILEKHRSLETVGLVGIRSRGVPLAHRLAAKLGSIEGTPPPVGLLDINLYRDDLSRIGDHPVIRKTEIPFDVDDAAIVLVDDVLFTGRTIRAALDNLIDLGRPRLIQLAVLVDRGHREGAGRGAPAGDGRRGRGRHREGGAGVNLKSPHLLGIEPLDPGEISLILDTAEGLAPIATRDIRKVPTLRGKTVVNFFVEPSTRTRSSFELAEKRLSADS